MAYTVAASDIHMNSKVQLMYEHTTWSLPQFSVSADRTCDKIRNNKLMLRNYILISKFCRLNCRKEVSLTEDNDYLQQVKQLAGEHRLRVVAMMTFVTAPEFFSPSVAHLNIHTGN